jgi:hypothetical protein
LEEIRGAAVPPTVLSQLSAENQENTERCLWLTAELVKVMAAMEKAEISCIPFKGPTLAIAAYGDLGLRQFTDLDLFVRERDVARAKVVLLDRGFNPVRNLNRAREAALLRFDNASAFVTDRDVLLDLHWRFAPRHFYLPLETDDLWQRLQEVNLGTQVLPTLSVEDLLLVLCGHGFTHQWERLVWACDVANLIERRNDLDWDFLFGKARHLGMLRIVLAGLGLAREMGASLPPRVIDELNQDSELKTLIPQPARILASQTRQAGWSKLLGHQLRMRERISDKVTTFFRIMLTPRDYDLMFASVPVSLGFFYYLIRPIRMLRAFGVRVLSPPRRETDEVV